MTKTQNNNEGMTAPAAGEVAELVAAVQAAYSAYGWVEENQFIRLFDEVSRLAGIIEEGCDCSVYGPMNWQVEIERLRQHSQLQPVPVSERPWEREGWCDESGRCWCFTPRQDFDGHLTFHSRWILSIPDANVDTHCLPAHALPLPS